MPESNQCVKTNPSKVPKLLKSWAIRAKPSPWVRPSEHVPFGRFVLQVLGVEVVIPAHPDLAALHVLCTVACGRLDEKSIEKREVLIHLNAFREDVQVFYDVGVIVRGPGLFDRFQDPVGFKPIVRMNEKPARL